MRREASESEVGSASFTQRFVKVKVEWWWTMVRVPHCDLTLDDGSDFVSALCSDQTYRSELSVTASMRASKIWVFNVKALNGRFEFPVEEAFGISRLGSAGRVMRRNARLTGRQWHDVDQETEL